MRGVLRNTPVLLIDDCLSGVNMQDKQALLETVLRVEKRTLIVACNKFDFLKFFDKILLLRGSDSKVGSFEELQEDLVGYLK